MIFFLYLKDQKVDHSKLNVKHWYVCDCLIMEKDLRSAQLSVLFAAEAAVHLKVDLGCRNLFIALQTVGENRTMFVSGLLQQRTRQFSLLAFAGLLLQGILLA